jgi:hypothetical protein
MKQKLNALFNNELLRVLMQGVFAYIALMAVIIVTLQTPPEAIYDTNMVQVAMIFNEDPLPVVED